MQSLMILGRQPSLGLAELESLYGSAAVIPVDGLAALVDVNPSSVEFDSLGGSIKYGKMLTILDTTDWRGIEKFLAQTIPGQADTLPEGKLTLGLSVYGLRVSPAGVQATGLTLKKVIRKSGRSVRLVPNNELELNTAQVLHNRLTGENGWELLLVRYGDKTILAQTVGVQDIESYTVRDRDRPKRDTRVGMLPPKLAQILINLAVGEVPIPRGAFPDYIEEEPEVSPNVIPTETPTILDPFCGTGVVLQEAVLMGYMAYGTDIDSRMVEYSRANIAWLPGKFETGDLPVPIEAGDATNYRWTEKFTHVASETYLGRPFTSLPSPEVLGQTVSECNLIIKKFLKNIGTQIDTGTRLALAVPAWQVRSGQFKHLPLLAGPSGSNLDSLEEIGYNRISFEHVRSEELLYYREGQVVARELLILTKQ